MILLKNFTLAKKRKSKKSNKFKKSKDIDKNLYDSEYQKK